MSHFVCLALLNVPHNTSRERANHFIDLVLAPFSEDIQVAPYLEKCYCVGCAANNNAMEIAEVEVGKSIDEYRDEFQALSQEDQPDWEDFIKPLIEAQERLEKEHEMYNKPDPKCEKCLGSGEVSSTYSPESQWDWYTIGGRWTGLYSDYDPRTDPKNIENCDVCGGTGMRDGWASEDKNGVRTFKDDWAKEMNGCNGCHGTGKRVKWSLDDFDGDVLPVSGVLKQLEDKGSPFSILTPDGDWIERGKMGWWGMVADESEDDEWNDTTRTVLEKYPDALAVVVDCHI